ncbi:MAG: type 4a pilus biogenesis protein PilO [Candidatus Omnitrophota bacterium]
MAKILTKREKLSLFIALGVIVSAIAFNFIIMPVFDKFESLTKETMITRIKLIKYLQLLNQKDEIEKKYKQFSSAISLSGQEHDPFVAVLSELENLAKSSNIHILDVRPQSQRKTTKYKEIMVDLRTEGQMKDYMKFIYDIENSISLLRIRKIQLNAKSNTPALEGNISISQLSVSE